MTDTRLPQNTYDKFLAAFIPFVHRAVYQPLKSQFESAQPVKGEK